MLRNSTVLRVSLLALASLAFAPTFAFAEKAEPAPLPTVYVKAGHLFDATSDQFRDNIVLLVTGEQIQAR